VYDFEPWALFHLPLSQPDAIFVLCILLRTVLYSVSHFCEFYRLATGWTIGVQGFDSWRHLGIFLFSIASRPVLGPTQHHIRCVPRALSPGVKWPGRKLTSHVLLMPRSRIRGTLLPPPILLHGTGTILPFTSGISRPASYRPSACQHR